MQDFEARIARAVETLREMQFPKQVVVESTAVCDLKCPACPSPVLNRRRGHMPEETFRRIIDEIAAVSPEETELWFAFMGEALLYKYDITRVIGYATRRGVQRTYLNTNGTQLTPDVHEVIHASGLARIIISIDGTSPETFDVIRKGAHYAEVRDNVLALLERAKREQWSRPEIWVQMIVMAENAHEEEEFRRFWSEAGATVKVRPRFGWGDRVDAPLLESIEIPRTFPCPWLMRQIVICWDGTIVQCGSDHEATEPIGNIRDMTISEAWLGELRRRRDAHKAGDFSSPLCSRCSDWKVGLSDVVRQEGAR